MNIIAIAQSLRVNLIPDVRAGYTIRARRPMGVSQAPEPLRRESHLHHIGHNPIPLTEIGSADNFIALEKKFPC